jgi:perosamine synthetase
MTQAQPPHKFIPVAQPELNGNEKKYVNDCLDTGWISSNGKYVEAFEKAFAEFCEVEHAVACANGTVALHLALEALGIGPGDEVIVPTLTFIASANSVRYTGAEPTFVDCDPESWVISLEDVERAITPRTKAIMPVHLFGHPAAMDELKSIAKQHNLYIVEDAAEAHGAMYKGRKVGGIGDIGTFSFYGNKIITTGEGGMVTTNSAELADKVRLLRGQGQDPKRRYWFIEMGYNYRMTNIQAAIGLGQLENIDWHLRRRREIAMQYKAIFDEQMPELGQQVEQPNVHNVYWLSSFVLPRDFPLSRDETMDALREHNIESRPFFYPLHTLPVYEADYGTLDLPVSQEYALRGISLPCYGSMTEDDVRYVAETLVSLGKRSSNGHQGANE